MDPFCCSNCNERINAEHYVIHEIQPFCFNCSEREAHYCDTRGEPDEEQTNNEYNNYQGMNLKNNNNDYHQQRRYEYNNGVSAGVGVDVQKEKNAESDPEEIFKLTIPENNLARYHCDKETTESSGTITSGDYEDANKFEKKQQENVIP
ncbi:unnamed protein product [Rotaria magnacalcarata]|uniref:Uncharacterized protein n=1 Tax=Rotaria magnacalcarata TaxID=392030 RepID=A0A8S2PPT8_9BILA|nr:unnamed protein product [Rotaria magnacalcarata]CAF4074655.1 unnamed protein product [Rotaria magnacalcarata]